MNHTILKQWLLTFRLARNADMKQVCTDNKVSSIEKIGYGRGYNEALFLVVFF